MYCFDGLLLLIINNDYDDIIYGNHKYKSRVNNKVIDQSLAVVDSSNAALSSVELDWDSSDAGEDAMGTHPLEGSGQYVNCGTTTKFRFKWFKSDSRFRNLARRFWNHI